MFLLFLACVPSAPPGHGATEPAAEIRSLCAAGGQVVVEGDLDLSAATAEDVRGLDCVVAVLGDLIVDHNPELSRLDGLEQLVVVSGALRLRGNAVLTTLEDLAALDVVAGELEILDHPGFCDAQVDALLYRMGGDPAAVIRAGNTGPCPAGRWEEAVNDENAAYVCSGYSSLAVVGPLVLDAVDNLAGLDC
ncbi:MAG TPA: hypothetical protein PKY30_16265, partial [Myxococcota bacterium]|nr:hypothetical protein [Myxococcota bacterium]